MKQLAIVDTGTGNLFSLNAFFKRLNFNVELCTKPSSKNFDLLVLPGQGHFGSVMNRLTETGWVDVLNHRFINNQPTMGICVGMQIMFEQSDEAPFTRGLGWLKGKVEKLQFPKHPMIGWASVETKNQYTPEGDAYFVNSYAIKTSANTLATTSYQVEFCSAVIKDKVLGMQFHPEKSGQYGQAFVQWWLNQAIPFE